MANLEYEIVTLKGEKDEDMIPVLEEKGKLGWELVSVVGTLRGGNTYQYLAFLKRRVEKDRGEKWENSKPSERLIELQERASRLMSNE